MLKKIRVQKPSNGDVIVTTRPHGKNIWSHQPNSGPDSDNPQEIPYFQPIVDAMDQKGYCHIEGRVVTVETEPYYIENLQNGQFKHPETGNPANKVTQKTYVLFPDENVDTLLRQDGLVRKGEKPGQTDALRHPDEDLVSQDLGEDMDAVTS